MDKKYDLSNDTKTMFYGLALIAFGKEAVNNVLNQVQIREKYPDLIQLLQSSDKKYGIVLPGEIVYEIAGRNECIYDFYTSPDGARLYTKDRHKKWDEPRAIDIEIETKGYIYVPNQQALLDFGAICLFKAADSSYGIKGEKYE